MNVLSRYRFVVFGIVAIAAIGAFAVSQRSSQTGSDGRSEGGFADEPAGELGPTDPDVDAYAQARAAVLAEAAADAPDAVAAGLVSLARRLSAGEVEALLGPETYEVVFTVFPGEVVGTLLLESPLVQAVTDEVAIQTDIRASEVAALEGEVATATGDERADLEAELAERRAFLDSLTPDCACIYAVVVDSSTLGRLQTLAEHPDVRLVDVPDDPVPTLGGWQLTPLLPRS